ncbi:tetratricopeptide repeat protein [Mangrovibacterium lignilyticum]|uniref:tetratricopeptide repeat protein n=1 Tax=Mangrovibacterium lignilyticum TaxID=2668052 RepID=UPI0013D376C4|nr:tetratricopeptide repeat protein [Mangrovibacterium lignilyticum]
MLSKIKRPLFLHLFFYLFTCICFISNGAVQAQSDPETKAKKLFENGQYAEALPLFTDFARLYPTDPKINYYYGACLIETGQFIPAAQKALIISDQEKANWYLAQYYHANKEWANAMESYQEFKDNAGAKDLKSVSLDEMMQLCAQQINPYQIAEEESTISEPTANKTIEPEPSVSVSPAISVSEPKPDTVLMDYSDSIISFPVNAQITYLKIDQFKSDEARQSYLEARRLENKLHKELAKSKDLRERYENANELVKMQLADSILLLEQETYKLNQEIAVNDQNANIKESAYWDQASWAEVSQFQESIQLLRDSLAAEKQQAQLEAMQQAQIIIVEQNDSLAIDTLQAEVEPVDEITYRIQVGAYKNSPPEWVQRLFKKLSVLRRIDQYTDDQGVTVYTVGELKSYDDAQQMLKQIKLEGVSNATIAAYKNNERIPVAEARKLQSNGPK